MASIIYLNNIIELDRPLTTVGPDSNFDIQIDKIPDKGFSILFQNEELKLIPFDESTSKRIKGKWNLPFKTTQTFSLKNEVLFIALPFYKRPQTKAANQIDFDYDKLPQNPKINDYPQKLLKFILSSVGASQGGLFHRYHNRINTLSQINLKLKQSAESLLNRYLQSEEFTSVMRMSFETHTLLFQAGMSPSNFLLVRTNLGEDGEVILYLPETAQDPLFPEGTLCTLLHLASHGVSLHLAYRQNKKLLVGRSANFEDGYCWGNTPVMKRLKTLVDRLSSTDLSLVIQGETGSGKEGIARYIAKKSNSKMVSINCATIPQNLAESFLFGHQKGAFTGATSYQKGKIEEANGGILFLDEIAELTLEIQSKLLRALQDGLIAPIGGKEIKVSIRILAATLKNLSEQVKKGEFREDLFYRLNEASLVIPPLRERKDDINDLASFFMEQTVKNNNMEPKLLGPSAKTALANYAWPGNIRELRSLVRRMVILSENKVITFQDIKQFIQSNTSDKNSSEYPLNLSEAKVMFLKSQINKALAQVSGNKTKAATLLGITPRTLFRMIADIEEQKDEIVIDSDNLVIDKKLTT